MARVKMKHSMLKRLLLAGVCGFAIGVVAVLVIGVYFELAEPKVAHVVRQPSPRVGGEVQAVMQVTDSGDWEFAGAWEDYSTSGYPRAIRQYRHNTLHGVEVSWHENGVPARIMFWLDGRKEGPYAVYDVDGSLLEVGEYRNDVLVPNSVRTFGRKAIEP